MLVNSDASHVAKKEVRSRQRTSTSCTECRRRKQKCNQAKDRPCNNCARRYPPVECVYEGLKLVYSWVKDRGKLRNYRKIHPYKESVPAPEIRQPKVEADGEHRFPVLATLREARSQTPGTPIHGTYRSQLVTQLPSASNWNIIPDFRNVFSGSPSPVQERDPPDSSSKDISPSIRAKQFYSYPEHYNSPYSAPKICVGGVALEPLYHLPMETSKRNAELFHFFIQRLSPYMSSIDGNNPPESFTSKWMPFMTHSPIQIYVTLLTTSYFQATTRRIDVNKAVDAISAKMKLINLINEQIVSHKSAVTDSSIAAVMSLAYNELIYADEKSTIFHMRGLQSMIRNRGGLQKIEFDMLRKMLLRTDYQVACTFECNPFLHILTEPIPTFTTYALELDSPLLQSSIRFVSSAEKLGISREAAGILDDMRFLTTSIISLSSNPHSEKHTKFLATVHWIHERLTSTSSPNPDILSDPIYHTLHTTATIYSSAIITRIPLSMACTDTLLQRLWMRMWYVPLPRWKLIPGIFFWVLLVANPFARDKPEGRFLKGLMPASAMAMGVVDWDVVAAQLNGFLMVQKWLGGELREVVNRGEESMVAVSKVPQGGRPAWSISE